MKKSRPIVPGILLTLILLLLALYLVLSLGNFKFASHYAVEPAYRAHKIAGERYHFYCLADSTDSAYSNQIAVKRYGFLWKEVDEDARFTLYADTEIAGVLYTFEEGDTTHCFIAWHPTQMEPGITHYSYRTDRITVNGVATALEKYTYFNLGGPLRSLALGDIQLQLQQEPA